MVHHGSLRFRFVLYWEEGLFVAVREGFEFPDHTRVKSSHLTAGILQAQVSKK